MKTTTALYLLIFYTLALCKPIVPLVQDKLAHIFWKADHIATVHHHHGELHAEEEIAEAAQEEEQDKNPITNKTSEPVSVHIIVQILYNIPPLTIEKLKFAMNISNISIVSLDKHYPPPKPC